MVPLIGGVVSVAVATVTFTVSVNVLPQPGAETVYELVVAGFTVTGFDAEEKPEGPVHVYPLAPLADSVTGWFGQIVVSLLAISGPAAGNTVIVCVSVLLQVLIKPEAFKLTV